MTLGSKARPFIPEWGKRGRGYRAHRQIFKLGRMKLHSRFTFSVWEKRLCVTNNKGDVYGRRIVTNSNSKLKSTSGELIDVKGVAHAFIKSCRFSDKLTHFVVVICLILERLC